MRHIGWLFTGHAGVRYFLNKRSILRGGRTIRISFLSSQNSIVKRASHSSLLFNTPTSKTNIPNGQPSTHPLPLPLPPHNKHFQPLKPHSRHRQRPRHPEQYRSPQTNPRRLLLRPILGFHPLTLILNPQLLPAPYMVARPKPAPRCLRRRHVESGVEAGGRHAACASLEGGRVGRWNVVDRE